MSDELFARRLTLVCLLIALAEYLALGAAGFIWDDFAVVTCNSLTGSLANIPDFFSIDLWMSSWPKPTPSGYYRPLMLLSLALDRALWGLSPAGHHLHSVLWHLGAMLALSALLRRLVPPIPAALGVVFFGLHPIQSEAVAWITARNDLMVAAFAFGALAALVPAAPSRAGLALGGGLALLAMLSKESGVIVLPALLLLDLARSGRPVGWARYGSLILATLLWLALRSRVEFEGSSMPDGAQLRGLLERLPQVLGLYLGRVAAPAELTVGYTLEYLDRLPPSLWAGALVTGAGAALACARGRGLALAGLALFAGALAPALLALAVRGQLGERYLYLPMGGLALALAAALPPGGPAGRRVAFAALPIGIAWIFLVHERLPEWRDDITLWRSAERITPSGYTWASLAHALNGSAQPKPGASQGCSPDAFKAPEELAERDPRAAIQLFHRALREADPPYRDVCWFAVAMPDRLGDEALLREGIALTESADCPVTERLAGARTFALIRLGEWERARAELARLARQDWADANWMRLARAAVARHDGDLATYEALRQGGSYAPEELDAQVSALLGER